MFEKELASLVILEEVVPLDPHLLCGSGSLQLDLWLGLATNTTSMLLQHFELGVHTLVDVQVFPVLGRVAPKRVVQVLAFRQVTLHLHVLGFDHVSVLLIREVETAAITVKAFVEVRIEPVHVAASCGGARFFLRNPLVVRRPVLALRVRQFGHLGVVVVLDCSIASLKVERLSFLGCELLLGRELLSLSLRDSSLVNCRHGQPRVLKHLFG